MSEAIISVVVPAFNAERSLRRTISSILRQSLSAIEIIIVDDGSQDRTGAMADELASAESRITVIHQLNQGGYMARLNGLRRVTTKYFGFVDADDIVEPSMFETMVAVMEEHGLDVLQCGIWGRDVNSDRVDIYETTQYEQKIVREMLARCSVAPLVWNKVYLNRYDFRMAPNLNLVSWDDYALNLFLLKRVTKYGICHKWFYHYSDTGSGVTRRYNAKLFFWFDAIISVRECFAACYGFTAKDDVYWLCSALWGVIKMIAGVELEKGQNRDGIIREFLCHPSVKGALKNYADGKDFRVYWIIVLFSYFPKTSMRVLCWLKNLHKIW